MKAKKYPAIKDSQHVADAAVAYGAISRYQDSYGHPDVKLRFIRAGLETKALTDFISMFNGTREDVARLLNISDKTLRSYIRDSKSLDIGISEHLLQLFELFDKGIEVFSDLNNFRMWLNLPNVGLHEKPVNLLDSIIGIECVMDELSRIAFGALA
ncbi:putative toxin-antitoxin system antitoxin component, TIGR02293 family [bacterium A37T11]|nr:putative toxin-antitoxin system antitoxin component, TIGR02293 family [bacterium A37T11]